MPMCNAYVQCLCAMPMYNAYVQCLCAMPMCDANVQCPCALSMCNAYVQCLCVMPKFSFDHRRTDGQTDRQTETQVHLLSCASQLKILMKV